MSSTTEKLLCRFWIGETGCWTIFLGDFDKKETPGLHLWVSEGPHSIGVLDKVGQTAVSLRALENGNGLSIHDKAGKIALNLFVTQTPMGNGIVVYDQASNIQWTIPATPSTGGRRATMNEVYKPVCIEE